MPQKDPSRTEEPTEKRIEKAREEGNVAKSDEVSKVTLLLAGLIILRLSIGFIGANLQDVFNQMYRGFADFELTRESLGFILGYSLKKMGLILFPLFAVLILVAFFSVRLQVGPLLTVKVFQPKLGEKFNIIKGMQNAFFSLKTIVNLFKNLGQVLVVGLVAYLFLQAKMSQVVPLFYQSVQGIIRFILQSAFELVLIIIIPMFLIAVVHFLYTKWDYKENLKMTKEEVEDEQKQAYGNPEVKREQRKRMQSTLSSRMISDVPKADVVITNPTMLAVALTYNPEEAPAPLVLAKGAGHLARKIKEVATENDIPIRENKPLAQALYESVEVGEQIPEELYQAVASILAELYKYKQRQYT